METLTTPIQPSVSSSLSTTFRVLQADFGDGYEQTVGDGINNVRQEVSLTWEPLTEAEMITLLNFFVARQGYEAFYYTIPGDSERAWKTSGDVQRSSNGPLWTMSVKLREAFVVE